MSRPTKNEYFSTLDRIKTIKNTIGVYRRNIDKYLDLIIEIKSDINELENVLKNNEEIVMRYKLYEEKAGGIDAINKQ